MRNLGRWTTLFVALALVASGCERQQTIYDVQMKPTADGLERRFSGWREMGSGRNLPLSDADLARLDGLYPERTSQPGDIRQAFGGVFRDKLPDDVGGYGRYEAVPTPLGISYSYLERFRGSVKLDAEIYDRRAAVDRFCDLTVGWFDEQLKDAPERSQVRRFLNQDFRDDLRNLAAAISAAGQRALEHHEPPDLDDAPPQPVSPTVTDVLEFVVERDYVKLHEVSGLTVDLEEETFWLWTRRLLARKCGIEPAKADVVFAFLNYRDAPKSLDQYLRNTPEYRRLRPAAKTPPPADDEDDDEDSGWKVVEQLLRPTFEDAMVGMRFVALDELRSSLSLGVAPDETNGVWEPEENRVTWNVRLRKSGGAPTICYAAWVEPDETFQRRHLGSLLVTGKNLVRFAACYQQLSPAHRAEVDKHLRSLEPGDAIKGRVQDFRLVGEADETAQGLARKLIDVLADVL
ncbi:MAG: hypothetical protein QM775_00105 [Pirellulales bacterium]